VTGLLTLARGLWHRAGTSVVIFIVALCATAAATVGPTYFGAARSSILRDTLASQNVIGRGYQALQSGAVGGSLDDFTSRVDDAVASQVGGNAAVNRMFGPSVQALETQIFFRKLVETVVLAWRTDFCRHLAMRTGHCATNPGDVVVSTSLAADNHWSVGDVVTAGVGPPLTITGIYDVPTATQDYWFARGTTYFPAEQPTATSAPYDALFTPRETVERLGHHAQGSVVVSRVLAVPHVLPGDIDALGAMATKLPDNASLLQTQTAVTTGIPGTVETVHASWSALAVPVVVVTAELLVLTWLLLYLVVTDAVEARGTEIALAKLRGYGALRSMVFGLGEPSVLLAVALPVGAILGWLLTIVLARVLLLPSTHVPLPALGWVAAAIAAVGGIAAVVVAGRRTVVRPVVEQWRRTGRHATDRSWLFDAVVVTGAVAGLAQLAVTGTFSSASHSALALLVPGLLGLAVAVVASRLLPAACRLMFGRTRRSGGLGPFLAVRHIARRPGGTRTTMILATAIALATFSMCAWSVGQANRTRIAQASVGAPTVLTVALPQGRDLAATVDKLDPTGRNASAVEVFDNGTVVLTAVQPSRFASVAHWSAGFVRHPQELLSDLHPPASDPIILDGDAVRLHLSHVHLEPSPAELILDVVAGGSSAPTPVDLGVVHNGSQDQLLSGTLGGCPCVVRDLQVSPIGGVATPVGGTITIDQADLLRGHTWHPRSDWTGAGHWSDTTDQQVVIDAGAGRLRWAFFGTKGSPPTLRVVDHPDPMPAVVSRALTGTHTALQPSGLNGGGLPVSVVGTAAAIPGALSRGVVVDLDYAIRAAAGNVGPSTTQVWVRGDATRFSSGLTAAGIPVVDTQSSAALDDQLGRQGPGLASVLFLSDAAAAAVLAALAAILSLSAAARRRRYEYAALAATGASQRTLYAALAIEQLVVIGFGAVVGVATGLLSVVLAGRSVPEFVTTPQSPLLVYRPSVLLIGSVLVAAIVVLLAVAATAAAALLRSVTPDQLREAPV
jgi:putative ABC transport system permease protein